jgi:hypothetical protein
MMMMPESRDWESYKPAYLGSTFVLTLAIFCCWAALFGSDWLRRQRSEELNEAFKAGERAKEQRTRARQEEKRARAPLFPVSLKSPV